MDASIAARKAAAGIWRRLGEPLREGDNLSRMMTSYIGAGRDAEAKPVARRAIELLESLGPTPELALAYRTQAGLDMFQRDNASAIACGEKAVALAVRFDARETLVSSLNTIGTATLLAGDEANGVEHVERSPRMACDARLDDHVSNAYLNLGPACGEVFRFARRRRPRRRAPTRCCQNRGRSSPR